MSEKTLWRRVLSWPGTRTGKWSAGFLAGSIAFFLSFYALVAAGQRGGETFFSNPWLSLTILPAAFAAIVSGVLAIVAIVRSQERSLLIIAAMIFGIFVMIFAFGEIVFPH